MAGTEGEAGMLTDLPAVKDLIPRIAAQAAETLALARDVVSAQSLA